MSPDPTKHLHWTQRIALIRHNLHAASRSGDFAFFKNLQAIGFMEGTNHVATLSAELGDDADITLAGLDNLNASLAYVHQDAFKNVYENLKSNMRDSDRDADISKLYVDITAQKTIADQAVDKTVSSAIKLIEQQPAHVQESAANVWITGTTIIADSMAVSIHALDDMEAKLDDFIRMEESWNSVKASVVSSVAGLRGIFRLMDPYDSSPKTSPRNSSIVSASGLMLRRLSNAFVSGAPGPDVAGPASTPEDGSRNSSVTSSSSAADPMAHNFAAHGNNAHSNHSRKTSVSSLGPLLRTPNYMRGSTSSNINYSVPPTSMNHEGAHELAMIPPTPATLDGEMDPFDVGVPLPAMPAAVMRGADGWAVGMAV